MIDCIQDHQSSLLSSRLDKSQYTDADLISIKTSLNLPYYTSSSQFERVYGSVRVNGVDYEYVKRRVYNDTLELLCLPNEAKTQLQSVKNDWFKLSLEGQPFNKKAPGIIKITLPDFCQNITQHSFVLGPVIRQKHFSSQTEFLAPGFSSRQERPPQSMLFAI